MLCKRQLLLNLTSNALDASVCPTVVRNEICECQDCDTVDEAKPISLISNRPPLAAESSVPASDVVQTPLTLEQRLGAFLHPGYRWQRGQLKKASQFYIYATTHLMDDLFQPWHNYDISFGYPSNATPASLSPVLLYAMLLARGIRPIVSADLSQLVQPLEYALARRPGSELQLPHSYSTSFAGDLAVLFQKYGLSPCPEFRFDREIIRSIVERYGNSRSDLSNGVANDEAEAFVLCWFRYRINVSRCRSCMQAFLELQASANNGTAAWRPEYIAASTWEEIKDCEIRSPKVDVSFQLNVPYFLYTRDELREWAKRFGLTDQLPNAHPELYNYIARTIRSETFFHGKQPGLTDTVVTDHTVDESAKLGGDRFWHSQQRP